MTNGTHLYFDESGNTGVDLLNRDQPALALSSTSIASEVAEALIAPLLSRGQREAKYSKLKASRRGQEALLNFFSSPELNIENSKFIVIDKKYYLISHLVDKLIEPPLHESGIDLYERDAHVGLTNVWFYTGHKIFLNGHWDRILDAFLNAIRRRDRESYSRFDVTLTRAYEAASSTARDFATGLFLARGRLAEFIGVYKDIEAFDPAVDAFAALVQKWMKDVAGSFAVTHDRSKPLKRNEHFLRAFMTPIASRKIGYGARKGELPLRVSHLSFGDSQALPQLQVADVIAGAAVDALLAWSGRRRSNDYHAALKTTRLETLFAGGMLPSLDLGGGPAPLPGEESLVDGATRFLIEAGYMAKPR
jgi:hypothetical protein